MRAALSEWYRGIEAALPLGANCNVSLWSNDLYRAMVASLTVLTNPEAELVIEARYYRADPAAKEVRIQAEVCREGGPPLAVCRRNERALDRSAACRRRFNGSL